VVTKPRSGVTGHELAREAWELMFELFMSNRRRFTDVAAEMQLTPGDLHALLSIDQAEPRAMRSLAESWQCDASNVTWLVDRLEERGFVERRTLPTDRRVKTVVLTSAGETAQAQLRDRLLTPPPELSQLSPDALGDLLAILRRIGQTEAG